MTPKYRRPLNHYQISLIETLYKFRFATARQIARSQNAKHERVILSRLKILVDQNYIGKSYNSSYKIKGKPASYHLLPKAITYLRQQPYSNSEVLKRAYYDKDAIEQKIKHHLAIFDIYLEFERLYGNTFQFFSASEIKSIDYISSLRFDAYLSRTKPQENKINDILVYCLDGYKNLNALKSSIKNLILYSEEDTWQEATDRVLPTILIVCERSGQEYKVKQLLARIFSDSDSDFECLINNKYALLGASSKEQLTHQILGEPDSQVSL